MCRYPDVTFFTVVTSETVNERVKITKLFVINNLTSKWNWYAPIMYYFLGHTSTPFL
jgi:hypothetical protein